MAYNMAHCSETEDAHVTDLLSDNAPSRCGKKRRNGTFQHIGFFTPFAIKALLHFDSNYGKGNNFSLNSFKTVYELRKDS